MILVIDMISLHNTTSLPPWNISNITTPSPFQHDETYHFVFNLIVIVLSVAITTANIGVIVTYWVAKKIRGKTANLLLCDQAIVDIYNGVVVGGFTVCATDHTPKLLLQSVYQLSIGFSIHTILLISIERYIFILKPLFHRISITKEKMYIGIALSWIVAVVWVPLRLVHWDESNEERAYKIFIAVFDCYILILILIVGCLHALTYRAVKRFIKHRYTDLAGTRRKSRRDSIRAKQHIKEIRISKIFIAMFIAFTFTYIPVFTTGIVFITEAYKALPQSMYKYISLDLIFYLCNSICNPLITLIFKEDYRKNIKKFFLTMHSLTIFTRQYTLTRRPSSNYSSNWRKTLMSTIHSTVRGTPERKRRSTAVSNKRLTRVELSNAGNRSSTSETQRRDISSADVRRKAFAKSKLHIAETTKGDDKFHFIQTHQPLTLDDERTKTGLGNPSSAVSAITSSNERFLSTASQGTSLASRTEEQLSIQSSCNSSEERLLSPTSVVSDISQKKNKQCLIVNVKKISTPPLLFSRAAKYANPSPKMV